MLKELEKGDGGKENCILDTSILIDLFDKGDKELLEKLMDKCEHIMIPWVALYEFLYGHRYIDREIKLYKEAIETLGVVKWLAQDELIKALEIDVELHKKGRPIPFSDVLIAALASTHNGVLVTRNKRHFSRVSNLRIYVP